MKLKWTVEFEIDECWVKDGANLTDEIVLDMLEHTLPFAYSGELSAKVIAAPDPKFISKIQGYGEDDIS